MKNVYLPLVLLATALTGCGGGSKDDSTADSYLQFYNGAAIAGNTRLNAGDTTIGTATFGDVSSVVAIKADSYQLELTDVTTATSMLSKTMPLSEGDKTLFILTQQEQQYDYLSLSFKRDAKLEDKFNLHLVNLSAQYPQLDVYLAGENKPFSEATLLESLSLHEITTTAKTKDIGKYQLYLTRAGQTTPIFISPTIHFAYENSYVLLVRDKHGPIAEQLSLDLVLNSSTVSAYNHADAGAQFRLYNSLNQRVHLALDNQLVGTIEAGQMSSYVASEKGDYSLSVRASDGSLLLNSSLLSLTAGDSKMVLLYNNAAGTAEALAVQEKDTPQQQSHDVTVANLVPDFPQLQFYFVRQSETISNARYHIKNLAFKKQQSLNLPKEYYAIALVQVAENGATTLLDKTASMMLEAGKRYSVLAEKDDAAPSGYKIKLVH